MKKLLGFVLVFFMAFMISCTNCSNKPIVEPTQDSIEVVAAIDFEHAVATDRQEMFLKFGKDYRWYESDILLPEFLDAEDVTSNPEMVVNIFQSIVREGTGYDTWVWKFQHFPDTVIKDSIQGFWIENYALDEQVIKLKYTEAFDRMMQANFPKPHSKYVTLRNPIGPVAINTQWIFGNIHEQLWVDAVTGDVKNSNPAFPDSLGFKMPLGEWP